MRKWVTGLMCLTWMVSVGQIKWDGEAGDGQWNSAANWSGDMVPVSSDAVILDNSLVTGSYNVMLPSGNISTHVATLTITPATLSIITVVLPQTNTADPGLLVSGTGDALVLNRGAVLRNSSGATSGTGIVITNTFRINDHGRYVHNTSRGNASIVAQLSTAPGTEHGEFEFDAPSGSATISLSNRHYGTLILSAVANGGTATYIGSGASPANVHGHLKINPGVTFSINMSASLIVHDSLVQRAASTFNVQTSSNNNVVVIKGNIDASGNLTETGTGSPKVELNGTISQSLLAFGWNIINNVEIVINNPQGVTLLSSLTIGFKLQLQTGRVITGANEIIIKDNAVVTGGSSARFIEGTIRKIGDESFTFPVGDGSIFAPLSLQAVNGELSTDEYVVRYHRSDPQAVSSSVYQSPLDHISYVEYWTINRTVGTSTKRITLSVGPNSFALDPSTLLVANWNGTQWLNNGLFNFTNSGNVNGYVTGELTSNVVDDPGIYVTLGTSGSGTNNPLPLYFVSIDVISKEDGVLLQWNVADTENAAGSFNLQHSMNGRDFETFDSVSFQGNEYVFLQKNPKRGWDKYRVMYVGHNGFTVTSPVKRVRDNVQTMNIFPNPAYSDLFISFFSKERGNIQVRLFDAAMRERLRQSFLINMGINMLSVNILKLTPGVYFIQIGQKSNGMRVVIVR